MAEQGTKFSSEFTKIIKQGVLGEAEKRTPVRVQD